MSLSDDKEKNVENPNCNLESWEAAQCPKLGPTFKQIVEKLAEVDSLLSEWSLKPLMSHECRMRILDILFLVNEILSTVGDLSFPYVEVMQHHLDVLEALRVPEISGTDL